MTAFAAAAATITDPAGCGGFTTTEKDTYTAANGDEVSTSATLTICLTYTPGVFQSSGHLHNHRWDGALCRRIRLGSPPRFGHFHLSIIGNFLRNDDWNDLLLMA